MARIPLVGESYALRSPAAAVQQTMNLIPQFIDDPNEQGKNRGILVGAPGYHLLLNLPVQNIRGVWSGGGRLFVVSGSHLYEVGIGSYIGGNPSTGAGTIISDFDLGAADNNPVQMFGNGTQLLIIANGLAYIDNGSGPQVCKFTISGYVDTSDTPATGTVTWGGPGSGDDFSAISAGDVILIDSIAYTVSAVASSTSLTLTASAGEQTNAYFSAALGDQVTAVTGCYLDGHFFVQRPSGLPITGHVDTSGTAVTWRSGQEFVGIAAGDGIGINGVGYVVHSVDSGTSITLTSTAGTQSNVPYGAGIDLGRQFNFSAADDGTNWDPLDFASKEANADYLQRVFADREQLYLFGVESSEIWQNTGDPVLPFQRIQGAASHEGLVARYAPVSLGGKVYFLGGSPRGPAVAYRFDGFTPQRISTHAVEAAWASAGQMPSAAIAYSYVDDGHQFWCLNFTGNLNTWVYDVTASEQAGTPIWHQRGLWNGSIFLPYRPQFHTFIPEWGADGMHIVGDYLSGKLWELNLDYPDCDGQDTKWVRTLPHFYAGGLLQFYGRMTLEMETGTIVNPGSPEPQIVREYSDDRGETFGNPVPAGYGRSGNKIRRVFWPSNGSSFQCRDRVFRFSAIGQNPTTLIDLDLEIETGAA